MTMTLPDFSRARVLVVGDLMLDRYWTGPCSRISPEAPVPVVRVDRSEDRPGGAGNVALNVATLGASARLMGVVGDDANADLLEQRLSESGVKCEFVRVPGNATITKLRALSQNQQLLRLDFEDGFPDFVPAELTEQVAAALGETDVLLLSDYGKGALREVAALVMLARERGIPVVVDPKGIDFAKYRGATLLTPNFSEFEAVVGHCADEPDVEQRAEALRRGLDLAALLVTRSEKGMSLFRRGEEALHQPTRAREVFDVTGAGDTVIATLAASLGAGCELPEAMMLANLAAGVVVAKVGTATVTEAELGRAMLKHLPLQRGVIEESALLALIEQARHGGERIVMTNGCFDILHAGHVAYLAEARALGDRLIVAVNDDASVGRLKGPSRPVNALGQRMAVLAALESVDWVVPFGEDTPARLIEALLPDVLVKGGDYKPEDIAGGAAVIDNGGEVRVLEFIDGQSTTRIIESIRKPV
jgi:D-beta-D-heptose 7-phosphate kinase/D-beta-D-heptose 1-phosphate adenosyltransferase